MALQVFYQLTIFYDLNVTASHVPDKGKEPVRTASCSVLIGWQPTKLTHLVSSCFEVYKDCPRAFWLFQYTYAKIAQILREGVYACEFQIWTSSVLEMYGSPDGPHSWKRSNKVLKEGFKEQIHCWCSLIYCSSCHLTQSLVLTRRRYIGQLVMQYQRMHQKVKRVGMRGRDAHGRTSRASSQNDLKSVPQVGRTLER